MKQKIKLGVLAIQGAFKEHIHHFEKIIEKEQYQDYEIEVVEISQADQLISCNALVIPGGESTSISITAERIGLLEPLRDFIRKGKPVWGTCAGLILLASKITNASAGQKLIGGLDIEVQRNAFGRQLNSFAIPKVDFSSFIPGCKDFQHAVFIRAPVVTAINIFNNTTDSFIKNNDNNDKYFNNQSVVYAPSYAYNFEEKKPQVEILSRLDESHKNLIVAVRQGQILGTAFHPELSKDSRFHQWFLEEFVLKL
ncbi:hypothetical protein PACTADRAFT_43706 [Pachysolen tannophilus NRRL Y-2460]|uniref:glutaminase n=1 Tax=Pachysolen tannophilus NRRL Y-2460 TaxID=669874 RepID=A0A1E4TSB8_PACTA|nr:hypothetical protein PACTADRAFT_43706 [Pachysolen tannophilus NRRL Y-2460]